MNLEEFKIECKKHGYDLSDEQLNQFDTYALLLQEYNEKVNLTAITQYEEIIEKHFYDSILPFFEFNDFKTLCDVGAGAGFPSIPLKIIMPDKEITIVETLNKRCIFLDVLVKQLGLKNVTIVNARAEEYSKGKRESYDVVTARAVANLNMLSELCIPLVKVNGYFIVLKGSQGENEYEEAHNAIKLLGCKLELKKIETLSDDSKRINLYLKKISKTPRAYPRQFSKIKKMPL